jgi:hypothetical protein
MSTATTMSGLEFDALPYEEGRRWELLEGELIEVSSLHHGIRQLCSISCSCFGNI